MRFGVTGQEKRHRPNGVVPFNFLLAVADQFKNLLANRLALIGFLADADHNVPAFGLPLKDALDRDIAANGDCANHIRSLFVDFLYLCEVQRFS